MVEAGDLKYMPSGLGGVLPCVVLRVDSDNSQVRCIDKEFYPMWLLSVNTSELTEVDESLKKSYKKRADIARKGDYDLMRKAC